MNWVDIVIITASGYFLIRGWFAGIIKTVFRYLSIAAGLITALSYSSYLESELSVRDINIPSPWMNILSFLILFLLAAAIVQFLGLMISKLLKPTPLGIADRALGAAFGLIKTCLICIVCTWLISLVPKSFPFQNTLSNSVVLKQFQIVLPWMKEIYQNHKSKVYNRAQIIKDPSRHPSKTLKNQERETDT